MQPRQERKIGRIERGLSFQKVGAVAALKPLVGI